MLRIARPSVISSLIPQQSLLAMDEMLQQQQQQQQQPLQKTKPGAFMHGVTPQTANAAWSAAPDPVGFSPVRLRLRRRSSSSIGSNIPFEGRSEAQARPHLSGAHIRKGGNVGSSRHPCEGDGVSSINTAPTEDENENDEYDDDDNPDDSKNGMTRPTLLSPSVAWSWYKPKSGTRSLFEMNDDVDDDEEEDMDNLTNKRKSVKHEGHCHVACLSPPQLVASTTADSFDFSEVGWGNAGIGCAWPHSMSPLRRVVPAATNQALDKSEFAFTWTEPIQAPTPTSPTQLLSQPRHSQQKEHHHRQGFVPERHAVPSAAAEQQVESPPNALRKPSCSVDETVSPLAMDSPLNKSRRRLSGNARNALQVPTLLAPPVLVVSSSAQPQGRTKSSQKRAPSSPLSKQASSPSLLNRRQSRSSGFLHKSSTAAPAVSCPITPASSKIVMVAAASTPASSARDESRRFSLSDRSKSPKIASASTSP
jgi:hypothetical protein